MNGLAGVEPTLAEYVRQADRLIRQAYPGIGLKVTSGFRSQATQDALRARWDAGDRRGLVARPAVASRHTEGRAVDLVWTIGGVPVPAAAAPLESYAWLADLFDQVGVRWGGPADPVHFEL